MPIWFYNASGLLCMLALVIVVILFLGGWSYISKCKDDDKECKNVLRFMAVLVVIFVPLVYIQFYCVYMSELHK